MSPARRRSGLFERGRIHLPFIHLCLDDAFPPVRENHQIGAVIIPSDLPVDGQRRVVGHDIDDSETETFWTESPCGLNEGGPQGIEFVGSGAHTSLNAAIGRGNAGRCVATSPNLAMQDLTAAARLEERRIIAALITTFLVQLDLGVASTRLHVVVDRLQPISPSDLSDARSLETTYSPTPPPRQAIDPRPSPSTPSSA